MTCIPTRRLRAYLDGELTANAQVPLRAHLVRCARCNRRLERLQREAELAQGRLALVAAPCEPDGRRALGYLRACLQADTASPNSWRELMYNRFNRVWKPVTIGVIILALLVGIFSFAPSRALARQLLSVFRVRKFAVVQVNPDQAQLSRLEQALHDKLFTSEPELIVDEPVQRVSSVAEASQQAGIELRLPDRLLAGAPLIEVKGRTEAKLKFSRETLTTILDLAGMDSSVIPADLQEGTVDVSVPAMVHVAQRPFELVVVVDPEVNYPDGIDPSLIGEAGLRLLGLAPAEARRISTSIDWTSTVILPVPTNIAEFRETQVAGEEAVVLIPRPVPQNQARSADPDVVGLGFSQHDAANPILLWQKNGAIYMLTGPGEVGDLVRMANSMF